MARADTTEEAAAVQRRAIQALTGPQRVELALQMSDEVMAITRAGIRARRPELDEAGVTAELHRRLGHDDLVR